MPFIWKGFLVKSNFEEMPLTKMSMQELKDYEEYLWKWMKYNPPNIVAVINAINREIQWRAEDSAFQQGRRS